jgi:hypothetical protein
MCAYCLSLLSLMHACMRVPTHTCTRTQNISLQNLLTFYFLKLWNVSLEDCKGGSLWKILLFASSFYKCNAFSVEEKG